MQVWVDDGLVEQDAARVSAFDHGLLVGDGVFETLKVVDGHPFALTRHLERLARSAAGLGLDLDGRRVLDAVAAVLDAHPGGRHRLRVTVTGGPGPLGSDRTAGASTLVVALADLPAWGLTADVVTLPWARNERSAVAGFKTISYADNVVALAHARAAGAHEGIFADTRGRLSEGTGSNVFLEYDGLLVTPPLETGCLPGVTRALLLDWLPEVEELALPVAVLAEAQEAFLASSTRDVQPVRQVDGTLLPAAPGPLTQRAAAVFAERAGADPDP